MLIASYKIAKIHIFVTIFGMAVIFGFAAIAFYFAAWFGGRDMYGIYYNTAFVLFGAYVICTLIYVYIRAALAPFEEELEKLNDTGIPV